METLELPWRKKVRSAVIADEMHARGFVRAVCFTCGNSARELRHQGVETLEIGNGPQASLSPNKWWTPANIAMAFPGSFDATSGHLTVPTMRSIGLRISDRLGELNDSVEYKVPSGSGETVVCLAMAYPDIMFRAVYNNSVPHLRYEPENPMNNLVRALCAYEIV